jgi:hypothetical protein
MDTRKVTLLAVIVTIALVAAGVGYAYTATTSNTGNSVNTTYLTMVPYDTDRAETPTPTSYAAAFNGTHISYDSTTSKATAAGTSSAGGTISVGDEIIVYSLADDTFDVDLTTPEGNDALKIGQIYLQIDESKATTGDTYKILMKAGNEDRAADAGLISENGIFDTTNFAFKVGFQVFHPTGANTITAPITNTTALDNIAKNGGDSIPLPSGTSLVNYIAETGATSADITVNTEGFTIVLVTLWLSSSSTPSNQTYLLSEIYPASGTPESPLQPMTNVKFNFQANTEL